MSEVSVREFAYNPSAMFSRAERGETLTVTRHGKVVAILVPANGTLGRYAELVAQGRLRLKSITTDDLAHIPHYPPPEGPDPLDTLLAMREEDDR